MGNIKGNKTFCAQSCACVVAILLCLALLGGCGSKRGGHAYSGGVPGGKPYTVRGKTYYPLLSARGYAAEGIASWYGPGFHGKKTSSGERFNQNAMTAAHTILPFGSEVRVTHLANGKSIVVRINDRGPFAEGRIIDLSRGAAQKLGITGKGSARVRVESLE